MQPLPQSICELVKIYADVDFPKGRGARMRAWTGSLHGMTLAAHFGQDLSASLDKIGLCGCLIRLHHAGDDPRQDRK
jgi:hypothetical protein